MELNFDPFPVIETKRLSLRRMTRDDAEQLFYLRSHADVMKYIDRPMAKTVEDAVAYIDMIDFHIGRNEVINWAIALKDANKLIGTICLWKFEKENYRSEVGYLLHPDFQRKGIMTETIQRVVDFSFNKLNLHSLTANINPLNEASKKLLLSLGFEQEAYFRENYFYEGKFFDSVIFVLLNR